MKCEIVRDLLPLYCDDVCSDTSREAVEAHLSSCSACAQVLKDMKNEPAVPEFVSMDGELETKVLRGVKEKFSRRRMRSVLATFLIMMIALVSLTAAADVAHPVAYRPGLVQVNLSVDEAIDIYYSGDHYASFWAVYRRTPQGNAIYFCYNQTMKSSVLPISEDHGHICIGNGLMTDFYTACHQVPQPQQIDAVYYLEANSQTYLRLPGMSNAEFAKAAESAVLLWTRNAG